MQEVEEFFADLMVGVHEELLYAIEKHPVYPTPGKHWLQIVMEELGEACQAFNDSDDEKGCQELRQAIVTIARQIKCVEDENNAGRTDQTT